MYIKKSLIDLYKKKDNRILYIKNKSNTIVPDLLLKRLKIYNGFQWKQKRVNKSYLIYKKIGYLKGLGTRVSSVYKSKKKSKKKKKKK